ncbi:MAG: hypothetical protein AAFZ52_19990 [Bacteroidota bacterium]
MSAIAAAEKVVPETVTDEVATAKIQLIQLVFELPQERLEDVRLFMEEMVRGVDPRDIFFQPITFEGDMEEGYARLAGDEEDRREAEEWIEGTIDSITFDD